MSEEQNPFRKFEKEVLGQVSPTFCIAKWTRTTARLDQGLAYSCHHCAPPAPINQERLETDPSALTNTDQVYKERQALLDGERPDPCNYCWKAEESGMVSDRMMKSKHIYDRTKMTPEDVVEMSKSLDSTPKILELCFDNTCNFKCSYCSVVNSSKWVEETKKYGPFSTTVQRSGLSNLRSIPQRMQNPYIDAFWEWWPELKNELIELRITGGEPLMSKSFWKVLDFIIEEGGAPNMTIAVNSNFNPPANLFEKFLDYVQKLKPITGGIQIFTSIEAGKERSEYSRFGMDYDVFQSNVRRFLEETGQRLSIMSAINVLSIHDFKATLEWYVELSKEFPNKVSIGSSAVRYPAYLDIKILPQEMLLKYHDEVKQYVEENKEWFREVDRTKINLMLSYMGGEGHKNKQTDEIDSLRFDFSTFVDEYDERRGTDFDSTFPELADMFY